jgi:hypothetical protein
LPSLAESKQHLAHSGAQAKGQEGYECVSQQTPQTGLEVQHPTGHSYRQGLHLLSCLKEQVVVLASKPKSVPFHIVGPDNNWGPTWDKWKDRNVEFLRFLENATHTHSLSTGNPNLGRAEKDLETLTNDWFAIAIQEFEQATGQPGPEDCTYQTKLVSVAKLVKTPHSGSRGGS